jgi:hypothetical protein
MSQQLQEAKSAVVTVGDGRGFIVNYGHSRLVVTTAQCLPFSTDGESDLKQKTYKPKNGNGGSRNGASDSASD